MVEACRICLVTDVRMYILQHTLRDNLKEILGHQMLYSEDVPNCLCYECAHLLKKYIKFKQKCLGGQTILFEMLEEKNEVTLKDIKSVNRKKLRLTSNLSLSKLNETEEVEYNSDIEPDEIQIKEEFVQVNEIGVIKEELCHDDDVADVEPIEEYIEKLDDDCDGDEYSIEYLESELEETGNEVKPKPRTNTVGKRKKEEDPDFIISDYFITKRSKEDSQTNKQQESPSTCLDKPAKTTEQKLEQLNKSLKKIDRNSTQGRPSGQKIVIKDSTEMPDDQRLRKELQALEKDFTITRITLREQKMELHKRKYSSEYLQAPYKCDICYRGFLNDFNLDNHMVRHAASSGDYECIICYFRIAFPDSFLHHMSRHKRRFQCNRCQFNTTIVDHAKKHKLWHDRLTFKCQYCDAPSDDLQSHLSHVRTHHDPEFLCEECGVSYGSKKRLDRHYHSKHAPPELTESQRQEIELLLAQSTIETDEPLHQSFLQSVQSQKCRQCLKEFETVEALRVHQKIHALNVTINKLCSTGELGIEAEAKKWTKTKTSKKDKEYRCRKCNISCSSELDLQAHKETDSHKEECNVPKKEEPGTHSDNVNETFTENRCKLCDKELESETQWLAHVRVHLMNKLFEKRDPRLAPLKNKRKDPALKEYPKKCDFCSEWMLKRGIHYKHHMSAHAQLSLPSAAVCDQCGLTLPDASFLGYHITKTHSTARTEKDTSTNYGRRMK